MAYFHVSCSGPSKGFVWIVLLLRLLTPVLSIQYPIGSSLDRALPTLGGDDDSNVPPIVRQRGYWDPQAQVLCVGKVPKWGEMPSKMLRPDSETRNFEDVYPTMRSLCAKTAYGGTYRAWNAGAYCATFPDPPTVVFETPPPDINELGNEVVKRVLLACQQSCRCIQGTSQELIAQGRPAAIIVREEQATDSQMHGDPLFYQFTKPNPKRADLHSHVPAIVIPEEKYIPVYFLPEADARSLRQGSLENEERPKATTLWVSSLGGYWAPQCTGTVYDIYFRRRETTAQELCTGEWFGGSKEGNYGLVCRGTTGSILALHSEDAVAHPVFWGRTPNPDDWDYRFQLMDANCRLNCECRPPLPVAFDRFKSVLDQTLDDEAIDLISKWMRDRWTAKSPTSRPSSPERAGSSSNADGYRTNMLSVLRRKQACRTNTVNGFDLSGSIAAQKWCQVAAFTGRERLSLGL